jgi:hypothetical protein
MNLTIEQIIEMPESERIALIYRLAMYSEDKSLASSIERHLKVTQGEDYLQKTLDANRNLKAWD